MPTVHSPAGARSRHLPNGPMPLTVAGWAFRAHVLHLAEATGLPWRVVTLCAGLEAPAAERLMRCRPRRGRIPATQASSLLALDAAQLRHRARLPVGARATRGLLQVLVAAGFSIDDVAGFVRLSRPDTLALLEARSHTCAQQSQWLARAALQALGVGCPQPPDWARRAGLRPVA